MKNELSLQAEMVQILENWPENLLFWIKELYHIYKSRYIETVALKDINLKIQRGKFIGIVGPSGSGKTTLLNILGGLMLPTSGRIYFKQNLDDDGVINLTTLDLEHRTTFRRKNIGFIFQDYNLFNYLTVEENIIVPLLIQELNPKKNIELINKVLNLCNIEHRREFSIDKLSGGEKQRVQVAMALISQPKIILADEPTGNLDSDNSLLIFKLLKDISKTYNTTILTVSHDLRIKEFCDEILSIDQKFSS